MLLLINVGSQKSCRYEAHVDVDEVRENEEGIIHACSEPWGLDLKKRRRVLKLGSCGSLFPQWHLCLVTLTSPSMSEWVVVLPGPTVLLLFIVTY